MKKRNLGFCSFHAAALFSAGLLLSFSSPTAVQAAALEGSGTTESPYIIGSAKELQEYAALVNGGDYDASGILTSDITFTDAWTPIGGSDSASAFTGHFSGGGYTVSFPNGTDGTYQGLFGYNLGTIESVRVQGFITGSEYAGGIAAVNSGTISGCENGASVSGSAVVSFAGGITGVNIGTITDSRNQGEISSPASGSNLGGIAGGAREGSITGCFNEGTVSLQPSVFDPEYAEGCAGGITGLNYRAAIEGSGNYGTVASADANGYTGGITGLNQGTVRNCVNGASVQGSYYTGGITGYNFLGEDAGDARIQTVLNHGTVTSPTQYYGAICGVNQEGLIYDSYYMEGSANAGIGTSDNNGTTPKSASALQSGEVTYQLNGNRSSHPVWYQTLGSDAAPVLDASRGTVYRNSTDGVISYSNSPDSHTDHEFDDSGTCEICGYESVSLYAHSLTLDGAIGLNTYYYLDPMYYQDGSCTITASFTINGRTVTDSFDPASVISTGIDGIPQVYGFQLYLNSDEMTLPVLTELKIEKDGSTLVTRTEKESYRGYDYLKELYTNADKQYPAELQTLAQALATHDYYANEYFHYQDSYEPEIPLLPMEGVTEDLLKPYAQTIEDESDYPAKHYGMSMQFLSEHILYLYITSEEALDTGRLYMGYKVHGSESDYTYVQAKKSGSLYRAATEKAPASRLDTMWDCAFFLQQEDGSYEQITAIKTAGPLSYAASVFRPTVKDPIRKLNQALYLYFDASKTYFDAIAKE